jgi:UDP-N-acetylmuramate: L-alanyl-gamma-D-glutamyl-meso-diaminopimelate ligase
VLIILQDAYQKPEQIYFIPIGGTAMASLAGLLHLAGHRVTGVDAQLYPPMSTLLEELGIPVRLGFDREQVPATVDRVIIGNAVTRSNPEVEEALARRLPHLAQAEAVAHYLLAEGRQSLVVAGTHGKTTTSAMLSWVLETTGTDPTYLVGGLLRWSRRSFRLGHGPWMVIEGDEYNTAFFDRGPKFLHYRPHIFLLGPVELDHRDLYPNLDAVLTAFRAGTAQVPGHGAVIVNAASEAALAACRDATAPLVTVGPAADCDLQIKSVTGSRDGTEADLIWRDEQLTLRLPMPGRHNLENAAMALTAALTIDVSAEQALAALATFPGVARRMEIVGEEAGVLVVDDFAHHPTALGVTVAAARQQWPRRRLVVVYEPRSLTAARDFFQDAYAEALSGVDLAVVASPFHRGRLRQEEMIDRDALAWDLHERGVDAIMPGPDDDPVELLLPALQPGDLVIGCSSGDFGGFHRRLLAELQGGEQ